MSRHAPGSSLARFTVTATLETLSGKLREYCEGICDRTQLYASFQVSLDDPRFAALVREPNG